MKSPLRAGGVSLLFLTLAGAGALGAALPDPETFRFQHENVLGTSFELRVRAASAEAAGQAEARALAEIDRLARVFSSYSPDSEFSRWQRTRQTAEPVSADLLAVLGASERWQRESHGAFNPGAEAFSRLWQRAAADNAEPTTKELSDVAVQVARPAWRLDASARTAEHLTEVPLTLNALAKGYIIEEASAAAAQVPGVAGLLLEIGGDLRVRGRFPENIAVTDPRHDEENAAPLLTVPVADQALATSGGYRRTVTVRGQRRSHLIDPRSGEPVRHTAGVTVLAPDAMTADALSTTFSVLAPDESLRLAESTPGVACLLVLPDGRQLRSARWPADGWSFSPVAEGVAAKPAATATGEALELVISFEINRPEGGRYQRPYVAAWIEDKDAFPVRTVLLWLLQSEKGQRWIPDLRRWYRGDQVRRLAEEKDLVATVSGATRNPGKYSVVWDGKDDHGEPLKPGNYTFYLEAAREHGTYQLVKHEFAVGGPAFTAELKGNEEIKSAALEYRRVFRK